MAEKEAAILDQQTALALAGLFIKKVESAGFPVIQAYLYGSYAKDKQRPYSDIDVAVISPKFSGFRFRDIGKIDSLKDGISLFIEPMPFTPEKFEDWHPLVHEIKTTGIRLV